MEALFLFSSRVALAGFLEGFLGEAEDGVPLSRQELEAAFERELETMAGTTTEGGWPRFPVFEP